MTQHFASFVNGARYLNLYEPLCRVVEYVIVNPTWRPDYFKEGGKTI